jgi:hypothetical protein
MKRRNGKKILCYCAFCRTPHRIYKRKGVGVFHVTGSLLIALCFMWGFWGSWNHQAIPLFLVCLFLSQILLHFRWRLALICRQCGFDPLIYRRNPDLAAEKVKAYLDRRRQSPEFLLAPPLQLPKVRREQELSPTIVKSFSR